MNERYGQQKAESEAIQLKAMVDAGDAQDYNEAEKILHTQNALATPLEKLVPGIDLTKLSTKEEIEALFKNTLHNDSHPDTHLTKVGRTQSGTKFVSNFFKAISRMSILEDGREHKPSNFEEAIEPLKQRFRGEIIIDIGPGYRTEGYLFANFVGAKAYIAVDIADTSAIAQSLKRRALHPKMQPENSYSEWKVPESTIESEELLKNKTPWHTLRDDGLNFLRSLPNDSVSVIMSGINMEIIPAAHLKEIDNEITRVLHPEGGFLIIQSDNQPPAPLTQKMAFHFLNLETAVLYIKSSR